MNTTSDKNNRFGGVVRWKGVAILASAGVLGIVYAATLADEHLRAALETTATQLNGARVNIGRVKTNFVGGRIEINDVQIAHPVLPMKNLFFVQRITAQLELPPLIRKKLILSAIQVNGIRFNTPRTEPGILELDTAAATSTPNLLDRVATGLYTGIREELADNPLRFLGQLSTGINLKGKLDSFKRQYASDRLIAESRNRLNLLSQDWEKLDSELPSDVELTTWKKQVANAYLERSSRGLASALSETNSVLGTLTAKQTEAVKKVELAIGQAEALSQKISDLSPVVSADVAMTRKALGLPRTNFSDLSPQVFGPRLLGYLERLSYWVDLSRRRMPKGSKTGPVAYVLQPRASGISVHFGKLAGSPSFLVKQITIHSSSQEDPGAGDVTGLIEGITSDPTIYQKPMHLEVKAAFPGSGPKGIVARGTIDHTGDHFSEKFELELGSYRLEDWIVTNTSDLTLRFKRAQVTGLLTAEFGEDKLDAAWDLSLKDVDYAVGSLYKQAEELLRGIISPVYAFEVRGTARGSFENPTLQLSSSFGERLASGLQNEYRHQLAAIDDNLTKLILDQTEPKRLEFLYRFNEVKQKYLHPLERRVAALREIQSFATQTVSRLHKSKTP